MIWQFNYHRGSAPLVGFIETVNDNDEAVALRVAQAWCAANNMRAPAGIRRWILANEGILEAVADTSPEIPDAVAATTAPSSFVDKVKGVLGR